VNLTVQSLGELWDFWTVKLAAIASVLGTIGVAWPSVPPATADAFPIWFGGACQFCALLITLGIIPARAVRQGSKNRG
jgi:hypothetical protein